MTRFKELGRIEVALKTGDRMGLAWAESYSAMRIQIAIRKDHKKYWSEILKNVRGALAKADCTTPDHPQKLASGA